MGKSSSPTTTYKNNNTTIHRTSLSYPVCLLTMLLASHRYHCFDAFTPPPLPRCLHDAIIASMPPRRHYCLDASTPPPLPRCLHVPAIPAIPTSPNMPRQLAFSFLASLSGPRPPSPYPGPTVASETLLPLQNKTKLAIHMQYEL